MANGSDDFLLDDPFDDGDWSDITAPEEAETPSDEFISSILREVGIDGYDSIVIDFTDADPSELRGQRFDTIEEAIIYLYDIGILSFSEIVEFDDDTFGYVVTYDD